MRTTSLSVLVSFIANIAILSACGTHHKDSNKGLKKDLKQKDAELQSQNATISSLENEKAENDRRVAALNDQIKSAQDKLNANHAELEALKNNATQNQNSIEELTNENISLNESIAQSIKEKEKLAKLNAELTAKINSLTEEVSKLTNQAENLKKNLETKNLETEELKKNIDAKNEEIKQLANSLSSASSATDERFKTLIEEKIKLEEALKKASDEKIKLEQDLLKKTQELNKTLPEIDSKAASVFLENFGNSSLFVAGEDVLKEAYKFKSGQKCTFIFTFEKKLSTYKPVSLSDSRILPYGLPYQRVAACTDASSASAVNIQIDKGFIIRSTDKEDEKSALLLTRESSSCDKSSDEARSSNIFFSDIQYIYPYYSFDMIESIGLLRPTRNNLEFTSGMSEPGVLSPSCQKFIEGYTPESDKLLKTACEVALKIQSSVATKTGCFSEKPEADATVLKFHTN